MDAGPKLYDWKYIVYGVLYTWG